VCRECGGGKDKDVGVTLSICLLQKLWESSVPGVGQEESELDLGIEAEQRWSVEEGWEKMSMVKGWQNFKVRARC
jgi:hypothetical protein